MERFSVDAVAAVELLKLDRTRICDAGLLSRGSAECSSTSWPAGYSRTRDKPDEWQLPPDRPEVGL